MKKVLCILVLTCVILGAAFAQQKPAAPAPAAPAAAAEKKSNSIGLDLFQLFKGGIASESEFLSIITSVGYERLIASHFSLGGDFDFYFLKFGDIVGFYVSPAVEGRYYPMSENFEKLFLGTTLGFNMLSIDGSFKKEAGGFLGMVTSLKMGYKIMPNKSLYLEPSLSYVLSKISSASLFGFDIPTPLGWNGGLRLGFVF